MGIIGYIMGIYILLLVELSLENPKGSSKNKLPSHVSSFFLSVRNPHLHLASLGVQHLDKPSLKK
jgi:hypothetical protein